MSNINHIERKVLRIMINVSHYGQLPQMPTVAQLMRWTVRTQKEVYSVLHSLVAKEYIRWSKDKPNDIILLKKSIR